MTYKMIIHFSDGNGLEGKGVTEQEKNRLNYDLGRCFKTNRPFISPNGIIVNPQNITYIEFVGEQ